MNMLERELWKIGSFGLYPFIFTYFTSLKFSSIFAMDFCIIKWVKYNLY